MRDVQVEYRRPAPALRRYIDRYWRWHACGDAMPLLPIMPGPGGMELFFHRAAPFKHLDFGAALPAAHIASVRGQPWKLHANSGLDFVAVRFRAGAFEPLLPVAATDLIDHPHDASSLWGTAVETLHAQLAELTCMDAQATALDAFFLSRLRPALLDPRVEQAITLLQSSALRIEALAGQVGLGRRQLEYRFLRATGVAPARFRRLARLRRSLRALLLDQHDAPLTRLLDAGYYDQAQQVREFRELTGFTPGAWRAAGRSHAHFYNAPWPA